MRTTRSILSRRRTGLSRSVSSTIELLEKRRLLSTSITIQGVDPLNEIENQAFQGTVATFNANAADGTPITDATGYTAKITWGDGKQSMGTIGAILNHDTFPIDGSSTYAEEGPYPVTVEVDAPDGSTEIRQASQVNVADASLSMTPVLISATVGESGTVKVATLTDSNTAAQVTDFVATISWGDLPNTADPTGQIVSMGGGQFQIFGTHAYNAPNQGYNVYVSVTDIGGARANTSSTALVVAANAVPPLVAPTGTVRVPTNGTPTTLATFNDPDPNAAQLLTGLITWVDGTTSTGQISLQGGTTYAVTGSDPNGNVGPGTIQVKLSDGSGNSQTLPVPIDAEPPTSPPSPPPAPPPPPTSGLDLSATLDAYDVVPTKATDLHLNSFFGTESLTVPVMIQNVGTVAATGTGSVALYLSSTPTIDTSSVLLKSMAVKINLQPGTGQTQTQNIVATIAGTRLVAGSNYYLIARLTDNLKEVDNVGGVDLNNVAPTATTFEFLGTPKYALPFSNGYYFRVVRDVLSAQTPFTNSSLQQKQAGADPTDDGQFITAFEHPVAHAYLDSGGVPTIGIGLNLRTATGTIMTTLATDVQNYYAAHTGTSPYRNISSYSPAQIKSLLISQAPLQSKAPVVLYSADIQTLFAQATLPQYETNAQRALGSSWPTDRLAQVALTDLQYQGALYSSIVSALTNPAGPDYAMAGFKLIDKLNTVKAFAGSAGNQIRIDADYQNLEFTNRNDLGTL